MPNTPIQASGSGTTNGTAGDDTIYGTANADNIYGGEGDDLIYGYEGADNVRGTGGVDVLYGGIGKDQLDGGIGDDVMYGGVEDDSYVVDTLGDQVIEYDGEGQDLVKSFVSYTLGANLENLELFGTADLDGTGNELRNVMKGNAGDNVLMGMAGYDSIAGGLGDDHVNGGAGGDWLKGDGGADCFEFDTQDVIAADASDLIVDLNFVEGDHICLDGYGAGGSDLEFLSYEDIGTFLKNDPSASIARSDAGDNAVLTITRPDGHVQQITITDASGLGTSWAQMQPYLPPVAGADSASTGENTAAVIDVLANDTGPAPLTIASASVPAGQGSVVVDGGQLRFEPGTDFDHLPAGQSATVTLTYVVQTPFGRTATGTVTLTVVGANDGAVIGGVATGALVEDSQTGASGALTITDADDGEAVFQAGTFAGTYGALTLAADGTWTYALDPAASQSLKGGQVVADSVTVASADGTAKVITLQITGTNDAAVIGGTATGAVVEDGQQTATGTLTVSDVDTGEASFQAGTAAGSYGSLALAANGQWTYTLNNAAAQPLEGGQVVSDAITVKSADGTTKVVTVAITGANDAATIGGTATGSVTEDTQVTASGTLTVTDVDTGESSFQAGTTASTYGTLALAANGAWTYSLNNAAAQSLKSGQQVSDSVTVKSADGTTKVVTITVNGTNDAAVIGGTASGSVAEDGQQTASGTLTVSDVDTGEAGFRAGTTAGAYGSLVLNASGQWTYTLNNTAAQALKGGQVYNDAITVRSVDGTTKVVTVAITGANDAAVIAGTTTGTVIEDTQLIASGTLTVTDADAGQASFQAGTVTGSYGSLALAANGQWTYSLNNSAVQFLKTGETRTDTLVVKSADGTTKSVAITIRGTDDAAVIGGCNTGSVTEDCDYLACGRLTISDPEGHNSFKEGIYKGAYGYVLLCSDGSWTYILNPFDSGLDTLNDGQRTIDAVTIKAADGTTHAINITVNGQNECPTWANAFAGTGDANDLDNYKTGAVAFSSVTSSALGNANVAYGTTGADTLDAKAGNDTLYGWAGNDCLTGNTGNDTLYGGTGADALYGGADNDVLYGGSGADTLLGEGGNDVLVGGFGADRLTGGAGADTFRFTDVRDTGDTITDFVHGTDRIDLSLFKVAGANYDFDAPINAGRFSAGHDLIWYHDGSNTIVLGNTDSNPNTAEFVLTLAGRVDLTTSDFLL